MQAFNIPVVGGPVTTFTDFVFFEHLLSVNFLNSKQLRQDAEFYRYPYSCGVVSMNINISSSIVVLGTSCVRYLDTSQCWGCSYGFLITYFVCCSLLVGLGLPKLFVKRARFGLTFFKQLPL